MAETYERFKKTFDDIEKRISDIHDAIERNERFMGQTSGMINEGVKVIGNRVQELKDIGQKGKDIDDFTGDSELDQSLKAVEQSLSGIKSELTRMATVDKARQVLMSDFKALTKEIKNEIEVRKKKPSTKLGGNKSLPSMVQLLDSMKKVADGKVYLKLEGFVLEDYAEHQKDFKNNLSRELAKTKDVRLNAEQQMLDTQALDLRNLTKNVGRSENLRDSILEQCKVMQDALSKNDNKALLTAKAEVPQYTRELADLASMGERVLKNDFIRRKVENSPDRRKIESGLAKIQANWTAAQSALKPLANKTLK